MSQAVICPRCRQQLPALEPRCTQCAADLQPLMQVRDLANRYFNDGLRAARAGHWHRAAEQVAVTLALQPEDIDALVLLAKIVSRQGRRERAAELWAAASQLAPHRKDIRAGLVQSQRPVPPWQRIMDLMPSWQQLSAALPSSEEIADLVRGAARPLPRPWIPTGRSMDG